MSDERALLAVTLLGESEAARRLVVSWSLVPPTMTGTEMLLEWSRIAAVRFHETETWSAVLLAHRICRTDRTVDPDALRAVRHLAAQRLAQKKESRR